MVGLFVAKPLALTLTRMMSVDQAVVHRESCRALAKGGVGLTPVNRTAYLCTVEPVSTGAARHGQSPGPAYRSANSRVKIPDTRRAHS